MPQLVLRLWLGYGVALVLALLLTGAGGPDDRSEPTPVTYAIAAMLPIATVLYVRSVVRHLPGGIAREMWRRARSSLLNMWNLVVTAALLCVALAVCVVPGAGVLGVAALRPLALSIVVGVVVYVVQRQRR